MADGHEVWYPLLEAANEPVMLRWVKGGQLVIPKQHHLFARLQDTNGRTHSGVTRAHTTTKRPTNWQTNRLTHLSRIRELRVGLKQQHVVDVVGVALH